MESKTAAAEQQFDAFVQSCPMLVPVPVLHPCVKAMHHGVDMCFIAAASNLPHVQASHLSD
jgi:hypothetical protein